MTALLQVSGCGGAGWLFDGRLRGVGTIGEPGGREREQVLHAEKLHLREAGDHAKG